MKQWASCGRLAPVALVTPSRLDESPVTSNVLCSGVETLRVQHHTSLDCPLSSVPRSCVSRGTHGLFKPVQLSHVQDGDCGVDPWYMVLLGKGPKIKLSDTGIRTFSSESHLARASGT